MVTPEARPFATSGGLADVAGALPHALARLGHRVTLVLPRYRGVAVAGAASHSADVPFGPHRYPVTFHTLPVSAAASGGAPTRLTRSSAAQASGESRHTASAKTETVSSAAERTRTSKPAAASRAAKGEAKTAARPSAAKSPARAAKSADAGSVTAVFVDAPDLFDRDGLYGDENGEYRDNAFRFAVLSRGALEYARLSGQRPSVVHAHDWQTGLVPLYLKTVLADDALLGGVPSVFTIHNVAFQGLFAAEELQWIDVAPDLYTAEGVEFYGRASLLKAGLRFADRLTTVSPSYVRELLTPDYPFAFGFDGILASRAGELTGILNGIDAQIWDPEQDAHLPAPFTATSLKGKTEAKRALLQSFGLPVDNASLARPLVGMLSRLTSQKGFDLLSEASGALLAVDANWVLLGDGDRHYEAFWTDLARTSPDRVATRIGYDDRLAHLIHAGSDLFLMPSRYEPCGLNQMYAMRYGTVPIVRAIGGLADTVQDADESPKTGTGFVFRDFTVDALVDAVRRAVEAFGSVRRWKTVQRNAMKQDHSWDVSAREYVKVYKGTENREDTHGIREGTDADRRQLRTDDQRRAGRPR